MKQRLSLLLILSIIMIFTAACGSQEKASGSAKGKDSEDIVVKHQLGESKVKKNPKKVVIMDLGTLDTLDKFGLEDSIAGVPQQNLPVYLETYKDKEYKNIGSLKEPDFEAINEIKPDLIIISGRQQDLYDKFEEIAPTIFMGIDNKNFMKSFEGNVHTLAKIFGKEEQAEKELAAIESTVADIKKKAEENHAKALITLTAGGKVTAFGPESRFGLIHDVLGIHSAADKIEADPTHGQNISMEFIAETNPDILYVIDRDAAVGEGNNAKKVIENQLVKKTKAYTNDKIVYLDPGYWYLSGGGLVSVSEMMKEAQKGIE
ncbi:iron complex transport system substrate-binding protein [Peribacillus deserti]|uniref:Iron complex transport system substrate-binding protein n=1 Tax=Peribacillus deserti TaxID=673318 RepID=A0ABS2QLZ6_9BACI|nr:siderophore ABC transporter substrate-binding protein [Peribacillus deserti]MBM7694183.1 iron complex transport system substrate-binding protein [Peribacillus deserti]